MNKMIDGGAKKKGSDLNARNTNITFGLPPGRRECTTAINSTIIYSLYNTYIDNGIRHMTPDLSSI